MQDLKALRQITFQPATDDKAIQELAEVLDFVLIAEETYKAAKADDGGLNRKDLPKALNLLIPGLTALEGIETITGAFTKGRDEDRAALLQYLFEKWDIPNDQAERKIEKCAAAAVALYEAFHA